jgi:hypothetical protein
MARLSYMQRRASGIYEFRKRLPTDLAGKEAPGPVCEAYPELVNPKTGRFKGEIIRSLGTNDARAARRLDLKQAHEAQAAIDAALAAVKTLAERAEGTREQALPPSLSPDDLAAIEAETVAEILARDEDDRENADDKVRLQTREERARWPDLEPLREPWAKGMTEAHALVYGTEIDDLAAEFRAAYARRDHGIVQGETVEALRRHGVPIDRTSETFYQAGMAVLRGTVRAFDAMQKRHRGEIVETPPVGVPSHKPDPSGHSAGAPTPKLSEAFVL